MRGKLLSATMLASFLLAACGEKEQVTGTQAEATAISECAAVEKYAEPERWVYKKIDNSALPDRIGKDEMLLLIFKKDLHSSDSHKDSYGNVWVEMEGHYRICLVFADGTMYCANVDVDDMHYGVAEIPDHVQDWQDIYYVGKLNVQELITEIAHINITPNSDGYGKGTGRRHRRCNRNSGRSDRNDSNDTGQYGN